MISVCLKQFGDFAEMLVMYLLGKYKGERAALVNHVGPTDCGIRVTLGLVFLEKHIAHMFRWFTCRTYGRIVRSM